MTFANSILDCMPVSQILIGTGGSATPSTALCVWHPAVNTHSATGLRRSNLKSPFGQEKDSSAYVTASAKSGSSSHGRCQPVPDGAFHVENSLHGGGLCCGSTTDPRRALARVHYLHWSVGMQAICCRWPCPGQCGPNLICTSCSGNQSGPIIYSSRPRQSI